MPARYAQELLGGAQDGGQVVPIEGRQQDAPPPTLFDILGPNRLRIETPQERLIIDPSGLNQPRDSGGFFELPWQDILNTLQQSGTDTTGTFNDEIMQLIMAMFLEDLGKSSAPTAGGPSAAVVPLQPVSPPVLELLGEMRARRTSKRTADILRFQALQEAISTNLPGGLDYYPGYEPGGLADVLLGIVTGKGVKEAQRVLPTEQRRVERVAVPVPEDIPEPTVPEEAGQAGYIANLLMDAIRSFRAGEVVPV